MSVVIAGIYQGHPLGSPGMLREAQFEGRNRGTEGTGPHAADGGKRWGCSWRGQELERLAKNPSGRRTGSLGALRNPRPSRVQCRFLDEYESLDATGFRTPEEEVSVDFGRPDRLVALRDVAGAILLELAFDSTPGGFWVRKTGDSTVFRISNFVANRIAPTDSTLRERGR